MLKFLLTCSAALSCLLLVPRYRHDGRVRSTLSSLMVLAVGMALTVILSCLVVSTDAPLVDAQFFAMDRLLGFDWELSAHWVRQHPNIHTLFYFAYWGGLIQMWLIPILLGMTGRSERNDEFLFLVFFGVLLTIAISAPFPALGPWQYSTDPFPFDPAILSDYPALRDGSLRLIVLGRTQGLVSMPSYHTMLALFFAYSMRGTGPLFIVAVALNALMIVATPMIGGHYLVDVIAGALCAGALIAGYRHRASVRVTAALSTT